MSNNNLDPLHTDNNWWWESSDNKENGVNFDILFTPDPDFESRIYTPEKPHKAISLKTESTFPWFDLEDFKIPDENFQTQKPQPILHRKKEVRAQVEDKLNLNQIIIDEIPKEISPCKKQLEQSLSILEEKSVFYANRFQEILQIYPIDTPENLVKRYAKILLYMLEQFHIMWEKSQQLKFMVSLKKVLGEFEFEMEEIDYKNGLLKRGYIRPDEQFKEELEFLYQVYYECYKESQKELRKIQKAFDKKEKEKLYHNITKIEKEVLWTESVKIKWTKKTTV